MKRPLHRDTVHRGTTGLVLGLMLLLAAGCASTQKRFDKAQDLESQGRYVEAAEYYIKVVDQEEDWEEARTRLEAVGGLALEQLYGEAQRAEEAGGFEEAVRLLDSMIELREAAADVEVRLTAPEGYGAYRQDLAERAMESLIDRGEAAEQRGDWSRALDHYRRADNYTDDPSRIAEITLMQARVHIKWGEDDAGREQFRSAFGRAQEVINLLGPDHSLAEQAIRLQEDALASGTQYVAFLPFWRIEEVGRSTSEALLRDLNDVLLYDYWAAPLPFIATADAVQLRRELRRLRYDRTIITRTQAAEIGRAARADYVVVGELVGFTAEERNIQDKTRTVKLKGRPSTTTGSAEAQWIERTVTLELDAEVAYRIIDPRTRREVDRGTVRASVSDRMKRGVYDGDYRDLDLSGNVLSLFEDEPQTATQELEHRLIDDLAAQLADRIFGRLLVQIP